MTDNPSNSKVPNNGGSLKGEVFGSIGLNCSEILYKTDLDITQGLIHNQDLSKRELDLYIMDMSPSLMNGIICLTMGKLEKKTNWLAFFFSKKMERKELREGKN